MPNGYIAEDLKTIISGAVATNKYGSDWAAVAAQRPGWSRKSLAYLLDTNGDGAVNAIDAFTIQSRSLRGRWG